jgi:hypothetical protein
MGTAQVSQACGPGARIGSLKLAVAATTGGARLSQRIDALGAPAVARAVVTKRPEDPGAVTANTPYTVQPLPVAARDGSWRTGTGETGARSATLSP